MIRFLIPVPFLLAGCTVGPDYAGPRPVASAERAGAAFRRADPAQTVAEPPLARWWEAMADPRLNALVERGLAASPDVAIAEARVRKARAAAREQRANRLPTVSATGTAIIADLPAGSLALSSQGEQDDRIKAEFYNAGLDASWEIDLFGGRRRAAEAASAQADAARANMADAQVRLSAEIADNYVTLRELQQRLVLARRSSALLAQSLALLEQRERRGASSSDDVVRLRTELNRTQGGLLPLEGQIAVTLDQLALLTGDEPGAHDATLSSPGAIPSVPASVAIGDPEAMLRRRPDVRAAERRLAAGTAQIGVDVARQFPSVSIMGIIGLGGPNIGDVLDTDNVSSLLLPRINWSFLDFGRNRARVEQSRAGRDEAEAQYRKSVLAALSDAETSLSRFGTLRATLLSSYRSAEGARQSSRFAAQRFERGAAPLTSSIDAERAALTADISAVEAQGQFVRAFVGLHKALGLGWEGPEDR
ncbi:MULTISPECIES: efflux transporter outer membrane subunit [Sphingobium]|jgi:NodT family efflux transporter outer membrane factor (OMF) lipoprotein|uniref:efflux transporter outer membrane subunit n=1 Tax=Sphingobium TaxID=165695 RepID=UPI0004E3E1AB|nr:MULTISPECIES: efflux transporter outer membrane subunit [Sphingobium]KFD28054.1 RND transporter [Sphingobium yanoikuyae]MDV3480912.1 efflux transporter outer membrane subunit [Sphingobium yanoikuyae]HUD91126.1 efflux transporter outer membrane subunit [Sphingobium sp.]